MQVVVREDGMDEGVAWILYIDVLLLCSRLLRECSICTVTSGPLPIDETPRETQEDKHQGLPFLPLPLA